MPTDSEWEAHRATIYRIYIENDRPVKELMGEMRDSHGFSATLVSEIYHIAACTLKKLALIDCRKSQYLSKLKRWNFLKNLSAEEWKYVAKRLNERRDCGRDRSIVLLHGRRLPESKVKKAIHRYSFVSTVDRFLRPRKFQKALRSAKTTG